MRKHLILLLAWPIFGYSTPVMAGMFDWLIPPPAEQLAPQVSKYNANDEALGPTIRQGELGWCFAYVAADLVSQEIGTRVAPGQIALNYLNEIRYFRKKSFESFVEGGGDPVKAIENQMNKGFCPQGEPFNLQLQNWIEHKGALPPSLQPLDLKARIERNLLTFSVLDAGGTLVDLGILEPYGTTYNLSPIGMNCRELSPSVYACDSFNTKIVQQIKGAKFFDRVHLFAFPGDISATQNLSGNFNNGSNWLDLRVGSIEVGQTFRGDTYTVKEIGQNEVTFIYRPFLSTDFSESTGGRLAYQANQCSNPLALNKKSDQIRREYWSGSNRAAGDAEGINLLSTLDDLINRGRIVGLSYPSGNGSHIVTITGRICEHERIELIVKENAEHFQSWDKGISETQHCIYTVRNSASLSQKYLSSNAIAHWGKELTWID